MTRVKICGLRRREDVEAVNRALPDFVGFVFAKSRRRITPELAASLKNQLDPHIEVVGVFVNQNIEVIRDLYRSGIIDLAQLHGDENREYIERLRQCCGCRVIKALSVGSALPPLPQKTDYLLFDTQSALRGGGGTPFDWDLLKSYQGPPYFLAGGLSAQNVRAAVNATAPFCVDVSSGVETDGWKDRDKIAEFVRLVKENNG